MSKQPENTRAEPMTYERYVMPPDLTRQRSAVAARVDSMSHAELKQAASDLQIDTDGAVTKEDLAAVVSQAARPVNAE